MNANWIETEQGVGFFLVLRLYAPAAEFYQHKWSPADLVPLE
jgi:hypothetical protein